MLLPLPLLLLPPQLWAAAPYAAAQSREGYSSTTSPFYGDPLFDGAHDAELVWHEGEQCWWLTYLQNRFNSCAEGGGATGPTTGTDLGLASTPDGGRTWIYRGVMAGLDVPAGDRREPLPPNSTTAQYGGATWWRPAVTTVAGVYHGFFSQWEQTRDWGLWKVIHYSSTDMKNWRFLQYVRNSTCPPHAPATANCTSAYDSAVFRVGDGRYALFSAGPSPGFTGPHPPVLCTRDPQLLQWEECEDSLQLYARLQPLKNSVGAEGVHVIDRNASVEFEHWSWMNWEGRGPACKGGKCTPGTPNLARSSDGGLSWAASTTNLWGDDHGSRQFDAGQVAFQGPLVLQGERLFALYFTEFDSNNATKYANALPGCSASAECNGVSDHRSVLQLARVRLNPQTGWLHGNRSDPFTLALQPPPNAAPPPVTVLPQVWSVAKVEAAVIALAEIARWVAVSDESAVGDLSTGIISGFKLAEAGYETIAQPTVEGCVSKCTASTNCSAITYCANRTVQYCECSDQADGGCCFMMSHATDVAAGGSCRRGAHSNCGASSSAACDGWSSFSKLGLRVLPTDYAGDEYQRWRNPAFSESYFDRIDSSGSGSGTVWRLTYARKDGCGRCGGKTLKFQVTVAANGTITELLFNDTPLAPLQWRRHITLKTDDSDAERSHVAADGDGWWPVNKFGAWIWSALGFGDNGHPDLSPSTGAEAANAPKPIDTSILNAKGKSVVGLVNGLYATGMLSEDDLQSANGVILSNPYFHSTAGKTNGAAAEREDL